VRLNPEDELVDVIPTNGGDDILLTAASGQTIRFNEDDVRPMGRSAAGVTGMRFRADDVLVSCAVAAEGGSLLLVTSGGFGKRTPVEMFSRRGRGGLGVRGIRTSDARGLVVASFLVTEDDDVFIVASGGTMLRTRVADISVQGRDAAGVRLMNLGDNQQVAAVAPVLGTDDDGDDDVDAEGDDAAPTASDEG
jgi:DNA gyrase subunit A